MEKADGLKEFGCFPETRPFYRIKPALKIGMNPVGSPGNSEARQLGFRNTPKTMKLMEKAHVRAGEKLLFARSRSRARGQSSGETTTSSSRRSEGKSAS